MDDRAILDHLQHFERQLSALDTSIGVYASLLEDVSVDPQIAELARMQREIIRVLLDRVRILAMRLDFGNISEADTRASLARIQAIVAALPGDLSQVARLGHAKRN